MSKLILLSASALLFVTGCSGGQGGQGFEPVNEGQAQQTGSALSSSAESSSKGFEGGIGVAGMAAAECAFTVQPPQPSDADADGFPDELTTITVVNCMQVDTSGGATVTYTVNATFAVVDTALGSDSFAYDSAVQWSLDAVGADGGTGSLDYEGAQRATQPTASTFQLEEGARTTAHFENNGETYDSLEEIGWDTTYSPTDLTWDYRAEVRPLENGKLEFQGGWHVIVNHAYEASAAVSTPPPGLTIDVACETNIVAGSLIAGYDTPEGQAAVVVNWNGCGVTNSVYQAPTSGT